MATRDEIKSMIAYLEMAFPNYHPVLEDGINTVDVLVDLLGDLPTDTLQAAVKSCCSEAGRAFAPSAGEIRGVAVNLHARASGMPEGAEAWGAIMAHFGQGPRSLLPLLDHPLVQRALDCMGGFHSIGMSENNIADRAHFLKIYEQLKGRSMQDAGELPAVAGYIESKRRADAQIETLTDKLLTGGNQ